MTKGGSFISPEVRQSFKTSGRAIPRSIVQIPLNGQKTGLEKGELDLVDHISARINMRVEEQSNRPGGWFACVYIEVKEDDGMSWSAELLREGLGQRHGHWDLWCLGVKDPTEFPEIAAICGRRWFDRRAMAHGLIPRFFSLRSWWGVGLLLGALILPAALAIIQSGFESPKNNNIIIITLSIILLGLGSLLYEVIKAAIATRPRTEDLAKALQKDDPGEGYVGLVDDVAQRLLVEDFPRIVIVDDFEGLDQVTRGVLERYLTTYRGIGGPASESSVMGAEVWVFLEEERGDRLSDRMLLQETRATFQRVELYRQLLLDGPKLRHLAEAIGKAGQALEPDTVKALCEGHSTQGKQVQQRFEEHRRQHPRTDQGYTALDFLFLLSAGTRKSVAIKDTILIGKLGETGLPRTQLLKEILRRTTLSQSEFAQRLQDLRQQLGSPNVLEDGPEGLRVTTFAAGILEDRAELLQLPPTGLVHLYWALYWHDRWSRYPAQAYWVRKIAGHLCKADLSRVGDGRLRKKLVPYVTDTLLEIIEQCIDTCVLDDVAALLHKTYYLLQDLVRAELGPPRDRFLQICWRCYSVLGNQEFLVWILRVASARKQAARPKDAGRDDDPLLQLFLDTLPLPAKHRRDLGTRVIRFAEAEPRFAEALAGYARAQASWLALSLQFDQEDPRSTELVREAVRGLEALLGRLCEDPKDAPQTTELLALSTALWAYALTSTVWIPDRPDAALPPTQEAPASYQYGPGFEILATFARRFETLVSVADAAVRLAGKVQAEGTEQADPAEARMDFLLRALAYELCGVSLAAILTAYRDLGHVLAESLLQSFIRKDLIEKIEDVAGRCGELAGIVLPNQQGHGFLRNDASLRKIDEVMRMSAILWDRFGVPNLAEQMNIRRLQFASKCLGVKTDQVLSFGPLLESLSSAVSQDNRIGLLGNLVVAWGLRSAYELMGHYLYEAASIGLRAEFGPTLRDTVSILALLNCARLSGEYELTPFLAHLLREDDCGGTPYSRYLSSIPPHGEVRCALRLLNALRLIADPGLRAIAHKGLEDHANELVDDTRAEILALLWVFRLRDRLRSGEQVDDDEIRATCSESRFPWIYAWTLELMLENGRGVDELIKRSLNLLDRDPAADPGTTFFYLALDVAERQPARMGDSSISSAVRYLREGIIRWEPTLTAEASVRAYQVLYMTYQYEEIYKLKLYDWQYILLRRDHLRRIPALARQGAFFLIFREYCGSMQAWGLELDMPWQELARTRNLDESGRRAEVLRLKERGGLIPPVPVRAQDSRRIVSGRFLTLGDCLFSDPIRDDTAFDQARAEINLKARQYLPDLVDAILHLERLPEGIKTLVREFAGRFERFSAPVD